MFLENSRFEITDNIDEWLAIIHPMKAGSRFIAHMSFSTHLSNGVFKH